MIRVLNGYLPNPRKVFRIETVFVFVALEPTWDLSIFSFAQMRTAVRREYGQTN
jgi:hypothetical protein